MNRAFWDLVSVKCRLEVQEEVPRGSRGPSIAKMKRLVESSLRKTMEKEGDSLSKLLRVAGEFEYIGLSFDEADFHASEIIRHSKRRPRKRVDEAFSCAKLALAHQTSTLAFLDIWREFGQAVRELLIADYEGAYRSLRWMLETTAYWADMQSGYPTSTEFFEAYYDEWKGASREDFGDAVEDIRRVTKARFHERLIFKDRYRRLDLQEVLNNLIVLKGQDEKGVPRSSIRQNIRDAYSFFSAYSHFTGETLPMMGEDPPYGHSFYEGGAYNRDSSKECLGKMWNVLDLLIILTLLVETHFLDYSSPHELLGRMGPFRLDTVIQDEQVSSLLPYTKVIVGDSDS